MSERADPTLSTIEHHVITLGILDADRGWSVSSRNAGMRSKLIKLARVVSGQRGHQPLASPKLEVVREFAAETHRRHRIADDLVPALLKQGYRPDQIGAFAALAA